MNRPKRLPKYVKAYVDRHGKARYYTRCSGLPSVALPGVPWSPEFMSAHQTALEFAKPSIGAKKIIPRSMGDLTTRWLQTPEFLGLKAVTQTGLRRLVSWLQEHHGHRLIPEMRRLHVEKLLAGWTAKPSDHNRLLSLLRRLLGYAVKLEWIRTNPVVEFKKLPMKGTYATWSDEHIGAFEKRWPIGTTERLALDLLLWTAQRSADVRVMGRQLIRDGRIVLSQSKTGSAVVLPIAPALEASLATVPSDRLVFLTDRKGTAFTASTFSHFFKAATEAAGLPKTCNPHGLRKAACTRLALAGCTAPEIMAISGHRSLREVQRYIEAANQVKLAEAAMARVVPIGEARNENKSV